MFKRVMTNYLKPIWIFCITVVIFMFLLFCANSVNAQTVSIPDPNLEANIRAALDKPTGDITVSDMESIITLNANNRGIYSLSGLEHATNIENIYLQYNQISDLAPLASLTKLKHLFLSSNQIQDLSALSNLYNLQELVLWGNQIGNLAPLAGLNKLEELILSHNLIVDIAPLSNLNSLKHITMLDNRIVDLSPLSGLSNLNWLYIADNLIEDIAPIAGLSNLVGLSIRRNYIDISPGSDAMTIINNFIIKGVEVDYEPQYKKNDETPTEPSPPAAPDPISDPPLETEPDPAPKNGTEVNLGDINGDGKINIIDVTLLIQYILGLNNLSDTQKLQADVNNDSFINVRDATILTRYILGYINTLS